MTPFSELQDQVADEVRFGLGAILLKARLLAARLKCVPLETWVKSELEGYADAASVPAYRVLRIGYFGIYEGAWGSFRKNVPLSCNAMPADIREKVEFHRYVDNVATLEAFAASSSTHVSVIRSETLDAFRLWPVHELDGMSLNYVEGRIPTADLRGVLQCVRGRMLEFMIELGRDHPELDNDPDAIKTVPVAETDRIASHVFQGCSFTTGGSVVGDNYHIGQAGAAGPGARARDITFNQIWSQHSGEMDLPALREQLSQLRAAMRTEATGDAEQDAAIGAIAAAEKAAANGDGPGVLERLKPAGNWALSVATKVGVPVAVAALKHALGV